MLSKIFFKKAFWSLVLTGLLNWVAYVFYLYWTVWWIDIVAHFLGGMTVGFAIIWVYSILKDIKKVEFRKIFFLVLFFSIIVGVLWEFLELYIGATSFSDGADYWFDTNLDLVMDSIGSIVSIFYAFYILKNEQ